MDCVLKFIPVQLFVYVDKNMTKFCIVKKCANNSSCKNVSFFKIPKHCAWLDLFRLGDSTMYPSSCICSNHLKKEILVRGKTKFEEKCNTIALNFRLV